LSDYSLEATKGNKTWVETFQQIGVSADELRGKKPDELLSIVADGFERTSDVTKRAATASQLFGDDVGRKLLPILMHGSTGIKSLREEMQTFGGVLTEEDAAAARELTTDTRRLWYALDGLRLRIGIGLIPVLHDLTDGILDWMTANKDWLSLKIGQGVDVLTAAFRALTSPLGLVVSGIGGLVAAKGAATAVGNLAKALGLGSGALGASLAPLIGPVGLLVLAGLALEDLNNAADGGPSLFGELAESMGAGSEFQAAAASARNLLWEVVAALAAVGGALTELIPDFDFELPDLGLPTSAGFFGGAADMFKTASRNVRANTESLTSGRVGIGEMAGNLATGIASIGMGLGGRGRATATASGGVNVGNVTINANGLSAAEAEALSRRVFQEHVTEAYEAAGRGVR
jgi:hypothetical protein